MYAVNFQRLQYKEAQEAYNLFNITVKFAYEFVYEQDINRY